MMRLTAFDGVDAITEGMSDTLLEYISGEISAIGKYDDLNNIVYGRIVNPVRELLRLGWSDSEVMSLSKGLLQAAFRYGKSYDEFIKRCHSLGIDEATCDSEEAISIIVHGLSRQDLFLFSRYQYGEYFKLITPKWVFEDDVLSEFLQALHWIPKVWYCDFVRNLRREDLERIKLSSVKDPCLAAVVGNDFQVSGSERYSRIGSPCIMLGAGDEYYSLPLYKTDLARGILKERCRSQELAVLKTGGVTVIVDSLSAKYKSVKQVYGVCSMTNRDVGDPLREFVSESKKFLETELAEFSDAAFYGVVPGVLYSAVYGVHDFILAARLPEHFLRFAHNFPRSIARSILDTVPHEEVANPTLEKGFVFRNGKKECVYIAYLNGSLQDWRYNKIEVGCKETNLAVVNVVCDYICNALNAGLRK